MTFKNKLATGLATAGAVLLLVAFLSYGSLTHSVEDRKWVIHTHIVIETLDDIQTSMVEAETGERGYIIAGEDLYLAPFQKGRDKTRESVKALRELTADNAKQQITLARLELLIQVRLAQLEERVSTRKQKGFAASVEAVREGPGKDLMNQIGLAIAGMKEEEQRLLIPRSAELMSSTRRSQVAIVVGEALGFFFLFIAGLVIQQEMKKRAVAEERVRMLNADLERKVAVRTSELAVRAKELERSNMELQQFAYVASHDLQEPLRTISSFTQLLAKRYQDKLDDKASEFIQFAVDGCKRMQTLINDLLNFSRVGTQGKLPCPVSLDAVVDRVLKSMRMTIEESRAVITRGSLPVVLADETQLCQLCQNLVGNAIKFTGQNVPRIHISAERNGNEWKITVRDNGIGIAPEHNDRVFVIFQRLHTRTEYPGTGIGLAICKKIAERHGGRIWVQPSPGGGSTFCFTMEDGESGRAEESKYHELRSSASAD